MLDNFHNPFKRPVITSSSYEKWEQQLVVGRTIAAANIVDGHSCDFGTNEYFIRCAFGGIISCGSTHTLMTPLDLLKCRLQVDSKKYKSIGNAFKVTLKEDGAAGLVRGWAPTLFGYSIQGMFKFGMYEFFKIKYAAIVGEETANAYKTILYLAASASGEFIADIGLAPFEAIKVKIQTSTGYASTLSTALPKMLKEGGVGGLYKNLVPLWMRQIPYTMMKFSSFENTVMFLYANVMKKPRNDCTKSEQLVMTFAAGYIAGVFCAIVSHPADTVVSKMSQSKGKSAGQIASELGFGGLWQGLGARIIMIGTLTALQWFVYDAVKVALRMPPPPAH